MEGKKASTMSANMQKIIHGDCFDILPGLLEKYPNHIIVTDPPFNIGYHYNDYHDRMDEAEYYEAMASIFRDSPAVIVHYPEQLYRIAFEMERLPDEVVAWVYNSNTAKQHRSIGYFGVKPDFRKVGQPYKNPTDKRIAKRIAEGKMARLYDWWEINQVKNVSKKSLDHPAVMPVEVMRRAIGILPDDAVIIDPFMGSGTTGLACVELGRDFIGIEMDEKYCDIARERLSV